MTTVVPFPARALLFPAGPLANAHGFPPIDERPEVDVTPGLDGYRVWLRGRIYAEFRTATNAARCAEALTTLASLDCLPTPNNGAA